MLYARKRVRIIKVNVAAASAMVPGSRKVPYILDMHFLLIRIEALEKVGADLIKETDPIFKDQTEAMAKLVKPANVLERKVEAEMRRLLKEMEGGGDAKK